MHQDHPAMLHITMSLSIIPLWAAEARRRHARCEKGEIKLLETMDALLKSISNLMDQIERMPPGPNGIEKQALDYLDHLLEAAGSGERVSMGEHVARLNHFWLTTVPWCSALSQALEKILIQYAEATGSLDGC